MADESGELVLVAAIALGMSEAVLQRVLLCLNPAIAQSVQRIYDLASLHREVDPEAALRLVAIWQAHRQQPAAAPDRPARSAANARTAAPPARRAEPSARGADTASRDPLGRARQPRRDGGLRRQSTTVSRKCRPARSSTSTIQTSGSNLHCRAR